MRKTDGGATTMFNSNSIACYIIILPTFKCIYSKDLNNNKKVQVRDCAKLLEAAMIVLLLAARVLPMREIITMVIVLKPERIWVIL